MSDYKTTHAIGDLVYVANAHSLDRDVIKAIKIVGVNEKVEYGIKRTRSHFDYFMGMNDEFTWYTPGSVFKTKEPAQAHHERAKSKYETEYAKEEIQRKKQRKAELEEELAELEQE